MKDQDDYRACALVAAAGGSSSDEAADQAVAALNARWCSPSPSPAVGSRGGTIKRRLVGIVLIIIAAACAIATRRWSAHDHRGSYLPSMSFSSLMGRRHGSGSDDFSSTPAVVDNTSDDQEQRIDGANPYIDIRSHHHHQPTPRQIELESQLSDLERTLYEEEDSKLRIELLIELLKSHRLNQNHAAAAAVEMKLRGAAKFNVGDAIEQLYNANTMRNRILYPFKVVDVHVTHEEREVGASRRLNEEPDEDDDEEEDEDDAPPAGGIRYTIVRLLDGYRAENIPESFLRRYVPYEQDTRALCNVGGYGMGQEHMSPCSVVEYIPPEGLEEPSDDDVYVRVKKEEDVLLSRYRVRTIREEGEVVEVVSMEKIQRHA